MLLDVGDKQYAVHFEHSCCKVEMFTGRGYQTLFVTRYGTRCSIHEGKCVVKGCGGLLHPMSGVTHCHPNDQFSKAAGRKVALSRAIVGMSRETRRLIWNEYFKQCPHK